MTNMTNRRQDLMGYGVCGKPGRLNPCLECGDLTNGLHHVVPVSLGGTKQVPLCTKCHGLVHGVRVTTSELIKAGIERRVGKGLVHGRVSSLSTETISKVNTLRKQGVSYRDIAQSLNISVGTAYAIAKRLNSNASNRNQGAIADNE